MINFFRKKRKKLADENKAVKYMRYAIGEIVLVVIGILIALSINNWNDRRNLENKTSIYLEAMNKEVKKNIQLIKSYSIVTHNDIIESANALKELHSKNAKYFNDSILGSVIVTRPIYKPILVKSTFNDLINSGILEHLNDLELKYEILAILAHIEYIDESYNQAKIVWDNYQTPYLMKHTNVAGNWDSINGVKIVNPKFNRTKEAFVYNKEYASILGLRIRMMGNYEENLIIIEKEFVTISDHLQIYLKGGKE